MDFNTIEIGGWVIKPIHFQAATFVVLLVFGVVGSFLYQKLKTRWNERGGRQLDHYLDTITYASEPDANGYRTLKIRNLGRTQRAEDWVRGRAERDWLIKAAKACDWTKRFIKDADPARQARILHVVGNAITDHFKEGEIAHLFGLPTIAMDLYYSPTGADAAVGGVRMIRNMIVPRETLEIFYSHPKDKWKFEKNKVTGEVQDHSVRVTTIREMAVALFEHKGCRELNGKMVRIVNWLEVRTPDTARFTKAQVMELRRLLQMDKRELAVV